MSLGLCLLLISLINFVGDILVYVGDMSLHGLDLFMSEGIVVHLIDKKSEHYAVS